MECSQEKFLSLAETNARLPFSVFLFSRFMISIRWQKKRANKVPRRIFTMFFSDWFEFLIHIHSDRRVLI